MNSSFRVTEKGTEKAQGRFSEKGNSWKVLNTSKIPTLPITFYFAFVFLLPLGFP